ncbi:MAG: FAD-dependent oxidoreductase [Oscillospiraceae bacterium]|nr:FAD-dependent oxidoreductase [Oscillospiraceae bacterium]
MSDNKNLYDVIIIGGGPAGLTAAIYLARARYRVLVLEREQFGGQITITHEVVNYPGIGKTSGKQLTETMRQQAEAFGAEFMLTEATGLNLNGDIKTVRTGRGDFRCFGLLLATGAHPRMVGFKGEEEHKGRGVAYCATCDGEFFTGKEIFMIGGGFAAAEESVFMTKFARHVTILMRGDDFTCAEAAADPARRHEKITIVPNSELEEVTGENGLTYARWRNNKTGEVTEYRSKNGETFGVFVFAGYEPATDLVKNLVELNKQGYILTDGSLKTSVDGVYAAGDVCIKPLRQVVTATGDGALAATELEKYAAAMQRKTGLQPQQPSPVQKEFPSAAKQDDSHDTSLFTSEMRQQLDTVFSRMEHPLQLALFLDGSPISAELEGYITALADMTDKLTVHIAARNADTEMAPCVQVRHADGTLTGLAFHGVPGGHEFTSFILGLYNAAGPGQSLDTEVQQAISALDNPVHIKVLVSLSCTMCPDLVVAAQHIAALNPRVTAEVYDLAHFEWLKERYQVMSVPCLVVNDEHVTFGKKNIQQLLAYLKQQKQQDDKKA